MQLTMEALIGFGTIFAVNLGHLLKYLSNSKVLSANSKALTTEITNLKEQVEKQNGNVAKLQEWQLHHLEQCHSKE